MKSLYLAAAVTLALRPANLKSLLLPLPQRHKSSLHPQEKK